MPAAGLHPPAQRMRQKRRLVVAPAPKTRPVEWDRGNDIRIRHKVRAGTGQPTTERRCRFGTVGMLEAQNQIPAVFVISKNRAGALKQRRAADAGRAKSLIADLELKRHAAMPAHGRPQKRHALPALMAKTARLVDDHAAPQAMGRQNNVEQPAAGREQAGGRGTVRVTAAQGNVYAGRTICHTGTMTDTIHVFNRGKVRAHRERAAASFDEHDFLFEETADRLADRLDDITHKFPLTLDLGCHGGEMGRQIFGARTMGRGGIERLVQADLSPAMARRARDKGAAGMPALALDEEFLPFAEQTFDAVISNLSLHWVNDLPGALLQVRKALKPDGLFLASMLGGGTLAELRECLAEAEIAVTGGLSPRVSPFADVRDLGGLLQRAGFALPVVDADVLTVSYETPMKLLYDLRGMGESNAVAEAKAGLARRDVIAQAMALYEERHLDGDNRFPASFQILTLTAWAPAPTQQQALRPGSAQTRLADALGGEEVGLGEKAQPDE